MQDGSSLSIFSLALTFFLIANPIGNTPAIVAILKDFPFQRQKKIIFREALFALLVAVGFQFIGERFLRLLDIQDYMVSIAGGVLLTILGLQMIFPKREESHEALQKEPFLVPIASPLITGGGLMSAIMLYGSMVENPLTVTFALLLAWMGVFPVMLAAPYIQKIFGQRGLLALEQLMGMLLILMSMELVLKGIGLFMEVV